MSVDPPLLAIGTRIRRSPYFEATRRWGCRAWTVYNHMYLPGWYVDPVTDWRALVERVALWDVAAQRQVEVAGPDAFRFVQYLTPRNLSRCGVGMCRYVPLTDEQGGMVDDPVLLRLGERHFWLSIADSDVLLWAKGIAVHGGFDVTLGEPDVSPLAVQGPYAASVIETLFGPRMRDLGYFRFVETDLDGIPLVVARSGWSNEDGFELYLREGSRGDELWERVMEAGKPFGIAPGAPSQISRVEGGMLSYGNDMGLDVNPYELRLGRFVDLARPEPFVGREALARIAERGPERLLVGFEIGGAALADYTAGPWPVEDPSGATVGRVTSAVWSPRLAKNIGLGLVRAELATPGRRVHVRTPEGAVDAVLRALPFLPRGRPATRA